MCPLVLGKSILSLLLSDSSKYVGFYVNDRCPLGYLFFFFFFFFFFLFFCFFVFFFLFFFLRPLNKVDVMSGR